MVPPKGLISLSSLGITFRDKIRRDSLNCARFPKIHRTSNLPSILKKTNCAQVSQGESVVGTNFTIHYIYIILLKAS